MRVAMLALLLLAGAACRAGTLGGGTDGAPRAEGGSADRPRLDGPRAERGGPPLDGPPSQPDRAGGLDALPPDGSPAPSWWKPAPGTSWQIQFSGALDTTLAVQMFDLDLFSTGAAAFTALKNKGVTIVCYVNAGAVEDWRPDAKAFPPAAVGNDLAGWPGEKWLDHRSTAVRAIISQRLDLAKSKGCHGVDPDNVDGYTHNTGFPLTYKDQIDYNTFLAGEAHKRGLAVGLKNDLPQVKDLVALFDFAINEQCIAMNECQLLAPFVQAKKAAFNIEYQGTKATVCPKAQAAGLDTLIKNKNLDAARTACTP